MPSPNGLGKPWGHGVALRRGTPLVSDSASLGFATLTRVRFVNQSARRTSCMDMGPALYFTLPTRVSPVVWRFHSARKLRIKRGTWAAKARADVRGYGGLRAAPLKLRLPLAGLVWSTVHPCTRPACPARGRRTSCTFKVPSSFPFPLELAAVCCPRGGGGSLASPFVAWSRLVFHWHIIHALPWPALLSNSQSRNAWPVSVSVSSSPRLLLALHLPLAYIYPGIPPESRPLKSQLCRRRRPFFHFCYCFLFVIVEQGRGQSVFAMALFP